MVRQNRSCFTVYSLGQVSSKWYSVFLSGEIHWPWFKVEKKRKKLSFSTLYHSCCHAHLFIVHWSSAWGSENRELTIETCTVFLSNDQPWGTRRNIIPYLVESDQTSWWNFERKFGQGNNQNILKFLTLCFHSKWPSIFPKLWNIICNIYSYFQFPSLVSIRGIYFE